METYVTTLGRPTRQSTLRQVPWANLVVQAHEYEQHRDMYPYNNVIALPEEIKTLGPTRRWCMRNLADEDGKIILLDDDLTFHYRNDPTEYHLRIANVEQMQDLWKEISSLLSEFAHVGVGGREGHNVMSPEESLPLPNCRYMRLLAYNVELFPEGIEEGRIDGMSDFDVNLQLLKKGCESRIITRWAQGHPGTQSSGGCSLNRTQETHSREVDFMVDDHSPFVTAHFKQNKTGGDFGVRKEVRIQWKKAFQSSQQ